MHAVRSLLIARVCLLDLNPVSLSLVWVSIWNAWSSTKRVHITQGVRHNIYWPNTTQQIPEQSFPKSRTHSRTNACLRLSGRGTWFDSILLVICMTGLGAFFCFLRMEAGEDRLDVWMGWDVWQNWETNIYRWTILLKSIHTLMFSLSYQKYHPYGLFPFTSLIPFLHNSTRPFLNTLEKKWIAFQILSGLSLAHASEVRISPISNLQISFLIRIPYFVSFNWFGDAPVRCTMEI